MKTLTRIQNQILKPFTNETLSRIPKEAGMTLLEIIMVVALLASLLAILAKNLGDAREGAMIDETAIAIHILADGVGLFRIHNRRFPTTDEGLEVLVEKPASRSSSWRGPYVEPEKLNDPWGNPYSYEAIGKKMYIISSGPDGQPGTEDDVGKKP